MKKQILLTILMFSLTNIFVLAGNNRTTSFQMPSGISSDDFLPKTIMLKVKNDFRAACNSNNIDLLALQSIFQSINISSIEKVFPNHQPPTKAVNEYGFKYADLSLIYKVTYNNDADLVKVINSLLKTGVFEYVEPRYVPHLCFNPNDPQIATQTFLTRINAYAGWDYSKGDTNTVIGIVDTGSDLDHPDLAPNLKYNYNDPINGIDDDNDGYIDNFNGWDLGENDNDATVGTCGICSHGSHVSGCADAATNNNIGVASPGFNCRFMPVKIADATGALAQAYEGITYASDHGCQIINCSWGGGGGGSFGQDVIDYATINKNALVVVAAGNNNSSALFFPAAYNYVLSVAATNSTNDVKASFSNYGTYIDVCAPGNGIFSTVFNNTYTSMSGTSMASPITAGVAAIVKSYFPNYNALQIGEQVRVTADNIYNLSGNSIYNSKLGRGRINLLNALTLTSPSVRMNPINFTDNNDDIFFGNDSVRITGDITNFLDPTTNLDITLTTTSPYVTILDGYTVVGALGTMATSNNLVDPFLIKINSNVPLNAVIPFKLLIQDGSYSDFQLFDLTVNVDYINITINDVLTSNTSKGRICYNADNQTEGLGFNFNNDGTLSYETGFMAGTTGNVSDNMRAATGTSDNDFLSLSRIQKIEPGVLSDFDTYGRFNDSSNPLPLGITVNHRSFSWVAVPNSKFHIFQYSIQNTGSSALNNFYAGIFSDWDVQNAYNNKADIDAGTKMGYIWCTDPNGYYAGIKLLTSGPFINYSLDNLAGGGGGVDASNGFTNAEKFTTLSTNRQTAGGAGTGNDVMDVVSTGPFSINAGDSITVAYALIAGTNLADLIASASQAQLQYNDITSAISDISGMINHVLVYPNPVNDNLTIHYSLSEKAMVDIVIFDMSGRIICNLNHSMKEEGNQLTKFNVSLLNQGFYLLEISTPLGKHVQKLTITR